MRCAQQPDIQPRPDRRRIQNQTIHFNHLLDLRQQGNRATHGFTLNVQRRIRVATTHFRMGDFQILEVLVVTADIAAPAVTL